MSRRISYFTIAVALLAAIGVYAQGQGSRGSQGSQGSQGSRGSGSQGSQSSQGSRGSAPASQPARKQYTFTGKVEKVDVASGTLQVNNDNIPDWMPPMSMLYKTDDPTVLKTLKAGDRITATVYAGDTSTLYQIKVAAAPKPVANALPPISYVCPSPGEESYLGEKGGRCPKSQAALVPVRLDIAYKCLRTLFIQATPGKCRVDGSDLVPVTASVFWTCPDNPDKHLLEPTKCSDGSTAKKDFEVRPHGDHNPRHGGPAVFMSEDQFHHVEATLVAPTKTTPAIFRAYFYDEYTRPLKATGYTAQVFVADQNYAPTGAAITLALSRTVRDGSAMEARIPNAPVPSESSPAYFVLHVKTKPTDKDWPTDYPFTKYSTEPPPLRPATTTGAASTTTPGAGTSTSSAPKTAFAAPPSESQSTPAQGGSSAMTGNGVDTIAAQIQDDVLPEGKADLLQLLNERSALVETELGQNNLGGLWFPALGVKNVVLALERKYLNDLPSDKRAEMSSAAREITDAAWQIDAAGDLGNKEKILQLYDGFRTAVGEVQSLYGAKR